MLKKDDKLLKGLHSDIQKSIKDMRSGKDILENKVVTVIEDDSESIGEAIEE